MFMGYQINFDQKLVHKLDVRITSTVNNQKGSAVTY